MHAYVCVCTRSWNPESLPDVHMHFRFLHFDMATTDYRVVLFKYHCMQDFIYCMTVYRYFAHVCCRRFCLGKKPFHHKVLVVVVVYMKVNFVGSAESSRTTGAVCFERLCILKACIAFSATELFHCISNCDSK